MPLQKTIIKRNIPNVTFAGGIIVATAVILFGKIELRLRDYNDRALHNRK